MGPQEEKDHHPVISDRLAAWAQGSCTSSSSSSADCPVDYISVNGQPKIRVNVDPGRSSLVDNNVRDKFAVVDQNGNNAAQGTTIVLAILLAFVMIMTTILPGSSWKRLWVARSSSSLVEEQEGNTQTKSDSNTATTTTTACSDESSSLSFHDDHNVVISNNQNNNNEASLSSFPQEDMPGLVTEQIVMNNTSSSFLQTTTVQCGLDNHQLLVKGSEGVAQQMTMASASTTTAISTTTYSSSSSSSSPALLEIDKVESRAREMTTALKVAQKCLRQEGHQIEDKDLIPWILQQQLAQLQKMDENERERRRYMVKAHEKQTDRKEAARLHEQDPQWMDRIRKGCDDLTHEVEKSMLRMLFLATCVQVALWAQTQLLLLETSSSSSITGLLRALAIQVCSTHSCSDSHNNQDALSGLGTMTSLVYGQSSCWISCACRCVFALFGAYVSLQLRLLLPAMIREMVTTLVFGSACFVAVWMKYISPYWYSAMLLAVAAYIGAHFQFFVAKSRLKKAFPGRNPTSHAVNEALDKFETQRRVYAMAPLISCLVHVGTFLSDATTRY